MEMEVWGEKEGGEKERGRGGGAAFCKATVSVQVMGKGWYCESWGLGLAVWCLHNYDLSISLSLNDHSTKSF